MFYILCNKKRINFLSCSKITCGAINVTFKIPFDDVDKDPQEILMSCKNVKAHLHQNIFIIF